MELEVEVIRGGTLLWGQVAELYVKAFQERPWNEQLTLAEVAAIMEEQFKKPGIIPLAAFKDGKVIGFSWAYEISQGDLEKDTRYSPRLSFLFGGGKRVFYFQEIVIERELRRQGFGEGLTRATLERAKESGAHVVVLSTNKKALPAVEMFSKIGFKDSGIVRPPAELGRTYWTFNLGN